VGDTDGQLRISQAARLQREQERGPERPVLAVADREPQNLTVAAGGDHDGLGDHPPVDPGLAVGRVQEHIRERQVAQRPVPEGGELLVQVRADPAHLALADAGVGAQGLDQSSTLRVLTPCR
jgi:hypothetical protein